MDIKLPFGIRNNHIIHISEILENEKGLKCNCFCPQCGKPLVARLGQKNIRHFAHSNENCKKAFETALHKFAKEILKENMKIVLPEVKIVYDNRYEIIKDSQKDYYEYVEKEELTKLKEKIITHQFCLEFDEIKLESRIGTIIPDIVVYKNNTPLLIEIAVTHFIDEYKEEKIKELDLSTIEIDLNINEIDCYNFDREEVKDRLINRIDNKRWVYNRKEELEKRSILEKSEIYYKKIEKQKIHNEKIKKQKELSRIKNIPIRLQNIKKINENYLKQVDIFDKELEKDKLWLDIAALLSIDKNTIPVYLNCKVRGEAAFNCDRRIWQCKIFEKFILNRKRENVKVSDVVKWIKQYSKLSIVRELVYTKDLGEQNIFGLTDAVIAFLKNLDSYGYLINERCRSPFYTSYTIIRDTIFLVNKKEQPHNMLINEKYGLCSSCGKWTNDWITYDGANESCLCRKCR